MIFFGCPSHSVFLEDVACLYPNSTLTLTLSLTVPFDTTEKNEIMLRRRHPSNDVKNETRRRHPSNDVGSAGHSVYRNQKLCANHDTRTPEKNEIRLRRRHPSNDVKNETRRRHPSNDVGSAGRKNARTTIIHTSLKKNTTHRL